MRRFAHLAHAACAPDAASEAVIRRAHQLLLTQRNAEAEELLRDVDGDALPVPARSQVLSMRATNLFWPLANPAAAAELVDNALHATDPVMAHPARANKALQLALSGRPRKALHVLERADPTLLDDISAVCRCRAAAAALGDRGQVDAAITASRDAARIAARNPRAAAHAMGVAEHAVTAAVPVGRLADAHTIAAELLEQTRDSPGIAHSVALAVSAMADLGSGRAATARHRLTATLDRLEEFRDNFGVSYRFRIVATQALARCGDLAAARTTEARMRRTRHPAYGFTDPDAVLASAAIAAAGGRLERARILSRTAAHVAHGRGQLAREVVCLQAAAQFGDREVAAALGALTGQVEGPRIAAATTMARAVAADDAHQLLTAATQFEDFGDTIAATDCLTRAARLFRGTGQRTPERDAAARAHELLAASGAVALPPQAGA